MECHVLELLIFLMQSYAIEYHTTSTVSEYQYHTPSREERRFLYFNHLSKVFLEQMIPHLKALILGV